MQAWHRRSTSVFLVWSSSAATFSMLCCTTHRAALKSSNIHFSIGNGKETEQAKNPTSIPQCVPVWLCQQSPPVEMQHIPVAMLNLQT